MAKYKVYFQIYGRKMVVVVEAMSEAEAVRQVREKLEIHKVERIDSELTTLFDVLGIK